MIGTPLLLTQGVRPKIVQERLGHSQISLTMDTYSHVLPSMQKEAAAKADVIQPTIAGHAHAYRRRDRASLSTTNPRKNFLYFEIFDFETPVAHAA